MIKMMIWGCFTDSRLDPLTICNEGRIEADEYKDILYDGLFSLIDDILQSSESDTICVTDENTFLFMQDNASCYKTHCILKFLKENHVSIMKWPSQSLDLNSI